MSDIVGQSRLLLRESSCLLYQPELAERIGKVEALVLQAIHYWINSKNESIGKIHQGKRWVYNTYKAWAQEIHLYSEKTIFRAIRNLEKRGILMSEALHSFKGNRTKWYTILYEKLYALLSSFPPQDQKDQVDKKMTRWSGPPVQIITETTSTISLNRADALNTLQPLVEKEQPVAVDVSREQELPPGLLEKEAFQALDIINTELETPLVLSQSLFKKTLAKRMRTHFGAGKAGLDRFREYCLKWADNAFLMGKKAMKSGDRFRCSVGSLLSEKMIEASWENKGFFQVYAPPKSIPENPQEEADMTRRSDPVALPLLTLDEVLDKAETPFDRGVKKVLFETLGAVTYQSWFHSTGFVAKGLKETGDPEFYIGSAFARDYVRTHYTNQLKKAFEGSRV